MPQSDLDIAILRIVREFEQTGNGIRARQQLGALHTSFLNKGLIAEAFLVKRILRGMR